MTCKLTHGASLACLSRLGRAGAGSAVLALALLVTSAPALADEPAPAASAASSQSAARIGQGVAVLGEGDAREEAFAVARAVYGSSLRPRALDEVRARTLAGDPAPATATREVRDLGETRASIHGEDGASKRLLSSIGRELNVAGLLVVRREAPTSDPVDAGTPEDAAATATAPRPQGTFVARLFLVDTGEFDAARYVADVDGGVRSWQSTVRSIERRIPSPPVAASATSGTTRAPAAMMNPSEKPSSDGKPFYLSPWLWGAIGAAVLVGGFVFFASRDTGDDPIHVQMRVPR